MRGKKGIRLLVLVVGLGITLFTSLNGCEDGKVNLFSLEDDKKFGLQLAQEIESHPEKYPLLSRAEAPEVYTLLEGIRDRLLQSGEFKHASDFKWEVRVINDKTLNAFCAPGGYIYFYTGILKYLDTEAQVAGVMGHEMAHADNRHSTHQMTKKYGVNLLLGLLVGENANMLTQIAAQLAQGAAELSFSRKDESEADSYAVKYLSKTEYTPMGVAGFFQKLESQGQGQQVPEFLSTHPSHEHRIRDIEAACQKLDLTGKEEFAARYKQFKDTHLAGYK